MTFLEFYTKSIQQEFAMLSPFAPHIAEEMWEKLGNVEQVSKSSWPEYNQNEVDASSIQSEELLKSTIEDIGKHYQSYKNHSKKNCIVCKFR